MKRKTLVTLVVLNSVLLIVVLAGFWMGHQAQRRAEMMRSHDFINNDRCLERVRELPEPRGGFSFAVVGDIQREINKLSLIMDALKQGPPVSFIIQTGDAVAHADSGHYRLFLNELSHCGLEVPLFVVPGNHDAKNDHENLFDTYFGSRRFRFEYGNALFIVADTARSRWDDEKSDWLRQVLESHRAGNRRVFLFMHQLPLDRRGVQERLIEDTNVRLLRVIEDYSVDYVFSGHRHEYRREKWRGTTFIVNGEDDDFDAHKDGSPCCYSLMRVGEHIIGDQRVELQPGYTLLVLSEIKDIVISHLGGFLIKNPMTALGIVFVAAIGVALSVVFSLKRYYQ